LRALGLIDSWDPCGPPPNRPDRLRQYRA